MGAISATTATDGDLVHQDQFSLSLELLDWCTTSRTPFIYASSAATYGDGDGGFVDDGAPVALKRLRPMNLYGWSKHLFDQVVADRAVRRAPLPPQWAGLKFFNVFGPNEYHKGEMMSLIAKRFDDAKAGKPVRLFKSHRSGIEDGDQRRDFIYVDDAVAVMRWLLDTPQVIGTLQRRNRQGAQLSRYDQSRCSQPSVARPTSNLSKCRAEIRNSYQYFTQAWVENLHQAGYNAGFTPLEEAVKRYVTGFLDQPDRYR